MVCKRSPLYEISWHLDLDDNRLDTQMAAVELLNIVRPIVAIARYVMFGALAIHTNPETKEKLQENEGNYRQWFVQEVRRYYPFGPFLGARVRRDFIWQDCKFKKGTLVLLDVYGTNHSPKLWSDPDEFYPDRFRDWKGNPFDFIPQGGGNYSSGHRCAGEWLTIEVMKASFDFLTNQVDYTVPEQDLNINLVRMPTIPKSRFIMDQVSRKN